jgi:hypothetical protein
VERFSKETKIITFKMSNKCCFFLNRGFIKSKKPDGTNRKIFIAARTGLTVDLGIEGLPNCFTPCGGALSIFGRHKANLSAN